LNEGGSGFPENAADSIGNKNRSRTFDDIIDDVHGDANFGYDCGCGGCFDGCSTGNVASG